MHGSDIVMEWCNKEVSPGARRTGEAVGFQGVAGIGAPWKACWRAGNPMYLYFFSSFD